MEKCDAGQFSNILGVISEMYSKPKPSSFLVTLWWNALKNYSIQEVKKGLTLHMADTDKFGGNIMPKPADVIRNLEGTTAEKSGLAWSKVDKAVRHIGSYGDICFDDPIIHAVIEDMGGWIRLCAESTDKSWVFTQREFEVRYKGYVSKGETPEYRKKLTGVINADRAIKGYSLEEPTLVGDVQDSLQVLADGGDGGKKMFTSLSEASQMIKSKLIISS